MKNHIMINGSSDALAAIIHVNTTIGFLAQRQHVINLAPLAQTSNSGYVWKRVFQRDRGGRG